MFNSNFYPTPTEVIFQMISELEMKNKTILEPSAGKGNIIEICKQFGAKVIACEINQDLALIAAKKADVFLKNDFFEVQSDEISHIDYIIMNPPFINAEKHIMHAWEIAPEGCTIIALCNNETVSNRFYSGRLRMADLIEKNGYSINLGDVFSNAERKTNVEVALVHLFKPKSSNDEFADYLFSNEEDEQSFESGLVQYSYVRDIVGRYIQGVKMYDDFMAEAGKINQVIKPLGGDFRITFNAIEVRDSGYSALTRDTFKKNLQKSAWRAIFRELKMEKYLTKSAMDEVNKFVETQTNKPFTMKNIYSMIQIIVGTHGTRMQKIIEQVFDWLTEHHHDNRMHVEGWKTNSMYMVNQKFIAPYCGVGRGWDGHPEIRWSSTGERLDELCKALCQITGKNYDECTNLHDFFRGEAIGKDDHYRTQYRYKEWGVWYDWNFFEIKVFKKGTLHAKFKDVKVWEKFNLAAVKAKGWRLPEKTGSDFKRKETGVEVYS